MLIIKYKRISQIDKKTKTVGKEGECMATKSILKNVDIKDKQLGHTLVTALETATQKKGKRTNIRSPFREAKKEDVRSLFK